MIFRHGLRRGPRHDLQRELFPVRTPQDGAIFRSTHRGNRLINI